MAPFAAGFPNGPLTDPATGVITGAWRSFLLALYSRTGAGVGTSSAALAILLSAETAARAAGDATLTSAIAAELARAEAAEALLAPLASPALTGTPTAPTAAPGTNTTQLATTAFTAAAVIAAATGVASFNTRTGAVTLSSGDVTGALSFTPYNATNPTGYQTAAQVATALGPYALLAGPALTGVPTAPTAVPGTNTTQLATTAFAAAAVAVETARATAAEAALTVPGALNGVGRNLLHNALFRVQQRGAGPFTVNGNFPADRWQIALVTSTISATTPALADADRTAIGEEIATQAIQCVFGGTAGAGDFAQMEQRIEFGQRLSGKVVTLSFYAVATSGTPKIGAELVQNFGTGGSPSASVTGIGSGATAALSTTWIRYFATFTVPTTIGKTFGTGANDYTQVNLWLSSGATNNTRAGGIGVQSGTVLFWGAQLEIASAATALEKLDLAVELANCQRFYEAGVSSMGHGAFAANAAGRFPIRFVPKRAVPAVTVVSSSLSNVVSLTYSATDNAGGAFIMTATASGNCAGNATWTASAEL